MLHSFYLQALPSHSMAEHCIQEADFMQHMEARLEHFSLRGELENLRR